MRVAAFFAAFICGVMLLGAWKGYLYAEKRNNEELLYRRFVAPLMELLILCPLLLGFMIYFLLYGFGIWDSVCDAIVDWLSPYPRIKS